MRIGALALSLVLLVGWCGAARAATLPEPSVASDYVRAAKRFDAGFLEMRLVAAQRGWPGPRLPVPPPARTLDCAQLKCVALTFDDGPGEETDKVLDTLAAHRARATFFVLGQMINDDSQEVVRRMVEEGHQLGNHSWDHPSLTHLSPEAAKRELSRTQDVVRQVTGLDMRVMRPPYGATDHRVAEVTRDEGLAQIMWSLDTLDWRDRDVAVVARRAGQAKSGDIVLMHDIHPTTVRALPRLLDDLDRKGFTYVTVSELLGGLAPGTRYFDRGASQPASAQ